jgi:adenylate cyclase
MQKRGRRGSRTRSSKRLLCSWTPSGFTFEAERTPPHVLVGALDELFSRFDEFADRLGLEKIKTIGDAYMAVAGAPRPRPDHVAAAAEMALAVKNSIREARWPSGHPIEVRIGIATGPLVAGVIGRGKFAYDLWGDTVNLASRLELHGDPGQILVSETVAQSLSDAFLFSPPGLVDLKGKGPTSVRQLLGRKADSGSAWALAQSGESASPREPGVTPTA